MQKYGVKREELFITTKVSAGIVFNESSFGAINMLLVMFGKLAKSRFRSLVLNIWTFTLFTFQCHFMLKVDTLLTLRIQIALNMKTLKLKTRGR